MAKRNEEDNKSENNSILTIFYILRRRFILFIFLGISTTSWWLGFDQFCFSLHTASGTAMPLFQALSAFPSQWDAVVIKTRIER